MTLELRKYHLIKLITNLNDERVLTKIEQLLHSNDGQDLQLLNLIKPIKETLDIEALMKEQNYHHPTQAELDEIIRDAGIEEPIEELLEAV
ncbi:hypothetical protein [Haliscomenobacter hydrossis]|uniref:Uncharacterized protein n=1 Tax=Haliscomenobacter hydrossis (strain ATCC 27775 / DSM 1100 / LMG 10767 / O) TaxID=760192 RepID=F4KXU9_HALH1|nr:hypothetical protein [Haliscomenobacter hydrossis]AEE52608.1 hypothetical protein Halhy_4774 [Haliscomenobacter hydrossis DSM 1100]